MGAEGGILELSAGRSGGAYGVVGGTEEGTCCVPFILWMFAYIVSTPRSRHPLSARTMMPARVEAPFSCSHTSFCHILMLLLLLYFLSHSSGGVQGSYGQPCMTRGDWIPFEWSVIVGETRGPIHHCDCEYGRKKGKIGGWNGGLLNVNPGWVCYQKDDGKIYIGNKGRQLMLSATQPSYPAFIETSIHPPAGLVGEGHILFV